MKRLSVEAFGRARRFLLGAARPLDRALFQHQFEGAPTEGVLEALAPYANPDGGFGQALEPDVRTPSSSALATGIALGILQEVGCPAHHPLVRGALAYLRCSYQEGPGVWPALPPDANLFPHAPWWHDEAGSLARTFDGFLVIPRAALAASLFHYAQGKPDAWLAALAERTVADIESVEPFGVGGGDDLVYTLRLAQTDPAPPALRARLLRRIRAVVPVAVSRDPQTWRTYCIAPLKVAPTPQSAVADLLADILPFNLDYLVEQQAADGAWDPTWDWGSFYPEVWPEARQEWRGHLTLANLLSLRAWGRLAALPR
ncbi:MAG: hypothetical protein GX605_09050 [Chloroflexi bacterium]|nr:hypothetical protein [Chloroflexota bacterium]